MRLTEAEIVAALEQACHEESFAFSAIWGCVDSDASAVRHHGGLTPRVARILGHQEQTVRRRLHAMANAGRVHRHKSGQAYRWWPDGLFARLSSTHQG